MKNRGVKGSFLAPRLFCFFLKIFGRRDFVCRIAPPHGKNIRERRKKQVVFNPREERRAVSERGNGSLRSDGGDVQTLDGKRGVGVAVHYGVQTCGQGVEHRQRQIEHAVRAVVLSIARVCAARVCVIGVPLFLTTARMSTARLVLINRL